MSNSSLGEVYFIAGMMVLILVLCIGATFIFVRQYRRERGRKSDSKLKDKKVSGSE